MSSEVIKVTVVLVVSAVLIIALRNYLGEYSVLLSIVTVAVVLVSVLGNLFNSIGKLSELMNKAQNISEYFTVVLKALGISYIAAFAADLCRDFGLSALAQTAELTGKIAIFILSLPLMSAVLEAALKFAGL